MNDKEEISSEGETQNQIANIEKKTAELKSQIKEINKKILSGKCPIRVVEVDGEVSWKQTIIREGIENITSVFKKLTATTDYELAAEVIFKGAGALPHHYKPADRFNVSFQALADSDPKDATEARLCLQSQALYSQGMVQLGRAERADMMTQSEFYMRNAIKLLRLHNETVEALNKYRKGGEQKMTVTHQHVSIEGQAIVNNGIMNTSPGGGGK
jgi:hypothetical protein